MLLATRDTSGYPRVFQVHNLEECDEVVLDVNGDWGDHSGSLDLLYGDDAFPFCENLDPGTKRLVEKVEVTLCPPDDRKWFNELMKAASDVIGESHRAGTACIVSNELMEKLSDALAEAEAML